MGLFRKLNSKVLFLLCLLLVLLLLCSQGRALHIHNMGHGHDEHLDHSHTPFEVSGHAYLSKAHPVYDLSHSEHHDGVIYEVDASPDGVLKNIFDLLLVLALSVSPFILLLARSVLQEAKRRREDQPVFYEHSQLSPPLRAPPLLSFI